jgi:hypothetical protein
MGEERRRVRRVKNEVINILKLIQICLYGDVFLFIGEMPPLLVLILILIVI